MSTTLTGEPQPKANGKGTHSERRRVGDTVAPPIPDWGHPQAVFDYKDARGNLLYQNVRFPLVTADGSPVPSSKGKPDKTFRLRRGAPHIRATCARPPSDIRSAIRRSKPTSATY